MVGLKPPPPPARFELAVLHRIIQMTTLSGAAAKDLWDGWFWLNQLGYFGITARQFV